MERCGFFDAYLEGGEYDRVYLAQHFAAYFASFIANGVYAEYSNKLQVMSMPTPQMQVSVESGQGWINGYWYENTDSLYLPIDVADGVLNRIDSVVLRLGFAERNMWLAIKKGTPAINPVAPSVTRSADYYELQLATISIPASSVRITQAQITDTRMDQDVCGWVTGVVQQLDTTTLFEQFEAYFAEFKEFYEGEFATWSAEQRAAYISWIATQEANMETWSSEHTAFWQSEFTEWFDRMKGQLSEDAAGHLQNQIDGINNQIDGYTEGTTVFSDDGSTIVQSLESGETLITTFVDKLTILQEWYDSDDMKIKQKRITFSQDGKTITEEKEVI